VIRGQKPVMFQRADNRDIAVGEFQMGRLGTFEARAFGNALILPDRMLIAANGCWVWLSEILIIQV